MEVDKEINEAVFVTAKDLVLQVKRSIEEIANSDGFSGIPTGFLELDKLTSGWQSSDLIIIASRPSMGKSAFALSMVRNMAIDFKVPVAVFSTEMTSQQIMFRLISSETGLSLTKLKTGKLEKHEWEQLSIKTNDLQKAAIYIDDSPDLTIQNLSDLTRKFILEYDVKVVVIDNIHLLSAGNNGKGDITREHEISIIARKLKALAKELCIPIIAISQLSREIESRGGYKRPILSDLRGSGTLEEIADIVSFIYRPEYYKIDEWDDEERLPTYGQAEFIVAKHRNGGLDNIRLKFTENLGKFDNLDDHHSPFEDLPSSMTMDNNPFITKNLPSANEAFGSNMNSFDDDSDVPF